MMTTIMQKARQGGQLVAHALTPVAENTPVHSPLPSPRRRCAASGFGSQSCALAFLPPFHVAAAWLRLRRPKLRFGFFASARAELNRLEDALNDMVDRLAAMREAVFGE